MSFSGLQKRTEKRKPDFGFPITVVMFQSPIAYINTAKQKCTFSDYATTFLLCFSAFDCLGQNLVN